MSSQKFEDIAMSVLLGIFVVVMFKMLFDPPTTIIV